MDKVQEMTRNYHPAFSSSDGDIILASRDGTYFRVPSVVLRMTSGFFRSALSLPRDPMRSDKLSDEDEHLTMDEPSKVVETLLSLVCCIGIDPASALATFEDVSNLLFAAEKYEVPGVVTYLRTVIMNPRFLEDPLRVYALSCRYGWNLEAEYTSRLTLSLDLSENKYRSTLNSLQGEHIMALLHLRWTRKNQLRAALDRFTGSRVPYKCAKCYMVIDTHAWRELKWLMLDEIEKQPSGESIKTQSFADNPTAREVFSLICPNKQCGRLCFDKDTTLENITKAINSLPSSIADILPQSRQTRSVYVLEANGILP